MEREASGQCFVHGVLKPKGAQRADLGFSPLETEIPC